MKKLFLLVFSVLLLSACSAKNENTQNSTNSTNTLISSTLSSYEEEKNISDKNAQIILASLSKGYSNFTKVSRKGKTNEFLLTPLEGNSEIDTLKKISMNPDEEGYKEALDNVAASLYDFTSTAEKAIGTPIKVTLVDPLDSNKKLFTVSSGKIISSIYDK